MMNNGCRLCGMGVGQESGLSQREVAEKYGIGKSSVARHRRHLGEGHSTPVESFMQQHGVSPDRLKPKAVTYRDDDGHWLKYDVTHGEVEDALSYDDIDFSIPFERQFSFIDAGNHADVLMSSDWQIGKAGQRGGGTPETVACIRAGFATFAQHLRQSKPKEAVLGDGGDIIENLFNTPTQAHTNDKDLTEQIRIARRMMAEGIKLFATLVPKLYVVAVPSNHGQVRVAKQAQAGTVQADFGLDINYSLEERFGDQRDYKHVEFVRPDSLEETAVLEVGNTKLAINHGHNAGSQDKHNEWWARQDHGRLPGWDADIMVLNHFHNLRIRQTGNDRWIISTSSPDGGSDWFSYSKGEVSKRGQTMFTVKDGMWSNLGIV